MSKPLTLRNREDKGDVDPALRERFARELRELNTVFPSYFDVFCIFLRFLMIQTWAAFTKRRNRRKHEIPSAAAIMAIV